MFVIRVIALALLISSLMLLGADVVTTLEQGGSFATRSLEQIIALLTGGSANAWSETNFPPGAAAWLTATLNLPGWLPTGILGIVLALIPGRRARAPRRPRVRDSGPEPTSRRPPTWN